MNNSVIYIIVMVVIMLLVGLVAGLLASRTAKKSPQYDERQIAAQGQAYKCSYFTLLVLLAGYILFDALAEDIEVTLSSGVFLCICISVMVFAVTCIMKDAYIAFNANRTAPVIAFALIGAGNLFSGIMSLVDGTMVVDGVLQHEAHNLMIGVMAIVIVAALIIRSAAQKKEAAEEQEAE